MELTSFEHSLLRQLAEQALVERKLPGAFVSAQGKILADLERRGLVYSEDHATLPMVIWQITDAGRAVAMAA